MNKAKRKVNQAIADINANEEKPDYFYIIMMTIIFLVPIIGAIIDISMTQG